MKVNSIGIMNSFKKQEPNQKTLSTSPLQTMNDSFTRSSKVSFGYEMDDGGWDYFSHLTSSEPLPDKQEIVRDKYVKLFEVAQRDADYKMMGFYNEVNDETLKLTCYKYDLAKAAKKSRRRGHKPNPDNKDTKLQELISKYKVKYLDAKKSGDKEIEDAARQVIMDLSSLQEFFKRVKIDGHMLT